MNILSFETEDIVQRQLDAHNAPDVEARMAIYADDAWMMSVYVWL